MKISLSNGKILSQGKNVSVSLELLKKFNLNITFNKIKNIYYTIIIRDIDASDFIHYFVINIINDNQGKVILPYYPPQRIHHHYYVEIYEQPNKQRVNIINRKNFDINNYIYRKKLKLFKKIIITTKDDIIKKDSQLTQQQKKYCECVVKVASKQSPSCNINKNWYTKNCYNPYAVCAKSVKTTSRCGNDYDFKHMDDNYIRAYANLSRVPIPVPYSKQKLIENIEKWKHKKY